jgi:hypothetical protein
MGYNRKTPSAIVYGPQSVGGIRMRHLFTEQGTMQAQKTKQHLRAFTQLGSTILIQLNWAQLVSGRSTPILEIPSETIPQLENEQWIQNYDNPDDLDTPYGKRVNELILMDITAGKNLSKHEIQQINKCRLYLKVESISDIENWSGTRINDNSWKVNRGIYRRDKLWPQQGKQASRFGKEF